MKFWNWFEKWIQKEADYSMPTKRKCDCAAELDAIRTILEQILVAVTPLPIGFTFQQIGDDLVTGNQVTPGIAAVFQAVFTPPGAALPAADKLTFAASDPAVVLGPSPDGDPTKVVVTFPATGDSNTSFQLAGQLTGPDFPTPVNGTPATISVVTSTPPLPTGFTFNQLS